MIVAHAAESTPARHGDRRFDDMIEVEGTDAVRMRQDGQVCQLKLNDYVCEDNIYRVDPIADPAIYLRDIGKGTRMSMQILNCQIRWSTQM